MDWSGDLSGRLLRPYIEAIVRATIERLETTLSTAMQTPLNHLLDALYAFRDHYAAGDHRIIRYENPYIWVRESDPSSIIGIGDTIDRILDELIVDDADDPWDYSRAHASGGNAYFACNYTNNSGNWHLVSDDETIVGRRWDWTDMLAHIGDPARIRVTDTGILSAEWLKQVYEILNRVKWLCARKGDRVVGYEGWYTIDYPTYFTTYRDATEIDADIATAKSDADSTYDATSDNILGGGDGNPTKYSNLVKSGGSWIATLATKTNRIPLFKRSALAFDFEVYALVSGFEEFDAHGTGLVDGLYNRYDSGSILLADAYPEWHDQALLGDNNRPGWFVGTPVDDGSNNRRGFVASAPIIVRKYDVTDGFAFLS